MTTREIHAMAERAGAGAHDRLRELLSANPKLANAATSFQRTPLHSAAYNHGQRETMEILVANGATIEAQDNDKRTPLHLAMWSNTNIVPALLDAGANPNALDRLGETPLHLAAHACRPEMISLLLKHGASVGLVNASGRTPPQCAQDCLLTAGQEKVDAMLEAFGRVDDSSMYPASMALDGIP